MMVRSADDDIDTERYQAERKSTILAQAQSRTALLVSRAQKGNPILKHFRDVVYKFSDGLVCDYLLGQHVCALFLSLRYHLLHPTYIYGRVKRVGQLFKTRVLLCLVDISDHKKPVQELTKLSVVYGWTVVCAVTEREAARYLEAFRVFEFKSAESIMERVNDDYFSKMHGALSSVRPVSKTDVRSLSLNFETLRNIANASKQELTQCPGLGETKSQKLFDAFNTPFQRDS